MVTLEKNSTAPPDIRDRCDNGCGAKALVRVVLKGNHDLVFCGHDFDQMESDLLGVILGICDTRENTP